MFRGVKPEGQPRSLRVIAEEDGASSEGFDGAVPYVPQSGLPAEAPSASQTYRDDVADARTAQSAPVYVPSATPFTVRR